MDNSRTSSLNKATPTIYRLILPSVVKLLRRHRPYLAPGVLLLAPNHIVKYGSSKVQVLSEALAIKFVSQNTTVPVPEILAAFQGRRRTSYLLMRKCTGVPLCNVFNDLSVDDKRNVLRQLRGFMDQLRALKPPKPGSVGSTEYGPLDDERLHGAPCGPFENVPEFHKAITGGVKYPTGHEECDNLITAQNSRTYETKFTHGDLSFRHIYYLNGKITGIIDWDSAGWFPDYWEYAMTWDSFWDNPDLRTEIASFLDPFPAEQQMEQTRRRLFRGI